MFVEDYMTTNPVTVQEEACVDDARRLMQQHGFRQLPVLDCAARLVGIITDRDTGQAVGCGEALRDNLAVADLMTADPITIPVSATLDEAVGFLSKHKFGALPVVRFGQLVGIISYLDALRALADIFGLDKLGHRIEVALPEGYADIARAFAALKGCTGQILSAVVSRTRRDGGEPALYLRVLREDAKQIERLLRAATMILLVPEHA